MKSYRWLSVSSVLVMAGMAMHPTGAFANEYLIDDTTPTPHTQSALPSSPYDGFVTVGRSFDNQVLTINSSYSAAVLQLGDGASSGNDVTITGAGTTYSNVIGSPAVTGPALLVGTQSANNLLTISGGAKLNLSRVDSSSTYDALIGYTSGATGNTLTVTGTGSTLSVDPANSTLYVGYNAGGNTLEVLNGGTVIAKQMRVGGGTGSTSVASNNTVTVSGAGSSLTTNGSFNLGATGGSSGSGNALNVLAGGTVTIGTSLSKTLTVGQDNSANNNVVTVSGAGSLLTAYNLAIGNGTNTGNTLAVLNSGQVVSGTNIQINTNSVLHYGVGGTVGALASAAGTVTITAGTTFVATISPNVPVYSQNHVLHGGTAVVGLFGSTDFTALPSFLSAALHYTAQDVYLNLTSNLGHNVTLNANQTAVAGGINTAFNSAGAALPVALLPIYSLSGPALAQQLTLLSGETATGGQQSAFQLGDGFLGQISDRLLAEPATSGKDAGRRGWTAWASGSGAYTKFNGDAATGSQQLTTHQADFVLGADYRPSANTVVGAAIGGGTAHWTVANGLGGGHNDVLQLGLYASTRVGAAYLAGSLGFSNNWIKTNRTVLSQELSGDLSAQTYGGRIEAGYDLSHAGSLGVTPYAALQLQNFQSPAYAETGGSLALVVQNKSVTDTTSELGLRLANAVSNSVGLRLRAAWAHDFSPGSSLGASFAAMPGSDFVVSGASRAGDGALVSGALDWKLAGNINLTTGFTGQFSGQATSYSGNLALRMAW